ncbi:MAG: prepilin-type N-terminal cleavage/methylation domain-containing protein, partial [Thiovulaceae bacterium]|nr:prepilin-type N-terminal cleavage/methylation domain-containing protein [Sulfurimonadaceae bacterium]
MIKKPAFSMLELIFVIVIIGVLSKFGVDLMAGAYKNFLYTKINNKLQDQSATAVEFIAKRLSYRINDSVIGRKTNGTYDGIQSIDPNEQYRVLEWVQKDIDGWRGNTQPFWSGIADINNSVALNSPIDTPETNVTAIDNLIKILSQNGSSISDAAIYFVGSNSDI